MKTGIVEVGHGRATAEIMAGDTVQIRPGNKMPADGEVIEGESRVDVAPLLKRTSLAGRAGE